VRENRNGGEKRFCPPEGGEERISFFTTSNLVQGPRLIGVIRYNFYWRNRHV
jgi:hypothetical protein